MYRSPFGDSFMSTFMNDPFFTEPFLMSPFTTPFGTTPFTQPVVLPSVRIEEIVDEEGNDNDEEEQVGYIVEDPDDEPQFNTQRHSQQSTRQQQHHHHHQHQQHQHRHQHRHQHHMHQHHQHHHQLHQHHQNLHQQHHQHLHQHQPRFAPSSLGVFDPFAMMREMVQQSFGSGFPPSSFPSQVGPGAYFSSSSTTYSANGNGIQYSKTSTTRVGTNGLLEKQETERNSGTGVEKMSIHRQLGERARTVTRQKNHNEGGTEQCHQTFKNIAPEEGLNFDKEWVRTAEQQNFIPNNNNNNNNRIPSSNSQHTRATLAATPYDRPSHSSSSTYDSVPRATRTQPEPSRADYQSRHSSRSQEYGTSRGSHVNPSTKSSSQSRSRDYVAKPTSSHYTPSSQQQDLGSLPQVYSITDPVRSQDYPREPSTPTRVDRSHINIDSSHQYGIPTPDFGGPQRQEQRPASISQDFGRYQIPSRPQERSTTYGNSNTNTYGDTTRQSSGY